MKKHKHIEILIELLSDIRKEPSPSVIGFVYSAALTHMFHLTFYKDLDPGRIIKHNDFKSKEKIQTLKNKVIDFPEKEDLFFTWKDLENMRNKLCYGYPSEEDLLEYSEKFNKIKTILENIIGYTFDVEHLEKIKDEQTN